MLAAFKGHYGQPIESKCIIPTMCSAKCSLGRANGTKDPEAKRQLRDLATELDHEAERMDAEERDPPVLGRSSTYGHNIRAGASAAWYVIWPPGE